MKIGIIHLRLSHKGGADNLVVWAASGLRRRGHAVSLLTCAYDEALWPRELLAGVEVRLLRPPLSWLRSARLRLEFLACALRRRLRGLDVALCHSGLTHVWFARAKGARADFPRAAWFCHDLHPRLHWREASPRLHAYATNSPAPGRNAHLLAEAERLRRAAARRANDRSTTRKARWDAEALAAMDAVLVNSRFAGENFARAYARAAEVCYPGIPLPVGARGSPARRDYVCVVSRLAPKKNVQNVIEALDILVNRWGLRGLHLKIAGTGSDRPALEALVARHRLGERVSFLGLVPDGDLPWVYRGARLAVYVPVDEPFGLVPLEAMACETPAIVSDHGGVSESVVHGETGLHVDPFDPEAIASAIRELWDDEARRSAMGARGAARVQEHFGLDSFLDRLEARL